MNCHNYNQTPRQIIWSGPLEWQEKQQDGRKIPRQVPCGVSAYVVNGQPEVKVDGWPYKLIMQLIPKNILGNLGGSFLVRDVKTVIFTAQACDALNSLTRAMDSQYVRGMAGCVHFSFAAGAVPNLCSIQVLILLYNKERQAYLGFIPADQVGFVTRIREVIHQHKQQLEMATGGIRIPRQRQLGTAQSNQQMEQGQNDDELSLLDLMEKYDDLSVCTTPVRVNDENRPL